MSPSQPPDDPDDPGAKKPRDDRDATPAVDGSDVEGTDPDRAVGDFGDGTQSDTGGDSDVEPTADR